MRAKRGWLAGEQGFTLLELFMILTIVAILCGVAAMAMPGVVRTMKGHTGSDQLMSFLRTARESAVSRRRTVQVVPIDNASGADAIEAREVNPQSGAVTLLRRVFFEQNMTYRTFTGQGRPESAIGNFGGVTPLAFTSEGTFVNASGSPVSVTIYLGQENYPATAAAATIFGPTGRLTAYKWNGSAWLE